jgi:hypothetical protein
MRKPLRWADEAGLTFSPPGTLFFPLKAEHFRDMQALRWQISGLSETGGKEGRTAHLPGTHSGPGFGLCVWLLYFSD